MSWLGILLSARSGWRQCRLRRLDYSDSDWRRTRSARTGLGITTQRAPAYRGPNPILSAIISRRDARSIRSGISPHGNGAAVPSIDMSNMSIGGKARHESIVDEVSSWLTRSADEVDHLLATDRRRIVAAIEEL